MQHDWHKPWIFGRATFGKRDRIFGRVDNFAPCNVDFVVLKKLKGFHFIDSHL